jgi:hypothetical protein
LLIAKLFHKTKNSLLCYYYSVLLKSKGLVLNRTLHHYYISDVNTRILEKRFFFKNARIYFSFFSLFRNGGITRGRKKCNLTILIQIDSLSVKQQQQYNINNRLAFIISRYICERQILCIQHTQHT